MCVQIFQQDGDGWMIDNSMCANKIPVWLAPSEGLLLDELKFNAYNKKTEIPEILEFTEEELQKISEFKNGVLYAEIYKTSEEKDVFTDFLKDNLLGGDYWRKQKERKHREKEELEAKKLEKNKIEENKVEESKIEENKVEESKIDEEIKPII